MNHQDKDIFTFYVLVPRPYWDKKFDLKNKTIELDNKILEGDFMFSSSYKAMEDCYRSNLFDNLNTENQTYIFAEVTCTKEVVCRYFFGGLSNVFAGSYLFLKVNYWKEF